MDGALIERQMAELGAYSFDHIANLWERQHDGERQLRLLTCQREGTIVRERAQLSERGLRARNDQHGCMNPQKGAAVASLLLFVQERRPSHAIRVIIVFCCQSSITLQVLYQHHCCAKLER